MLLGRNGAGKTTTLRTLMGLWRATQGSIVFDGYDITKMSTPDIGRLGIAYVPEVMGMEVAEQSESPLTVSTSDTRRPRKETRLMKT